MDSQHQRDTVGNVALIIDHKYGFHVRPVSIAVYHWE